jgi:hypothetical protein
MTTDQQSHDEPVRGDVQVPGVLNTDAAVSPTHITITIDMRVLVRALLPELTKQLLQEMRDSGAVR